MGLRFSAAAALATLVLGGCSAGASSSGQVVEIDIEHSAFDPAAIEVEAGTTVTFVITNNDPIAHEFILGDRTLQQVHERGTEAHHGSKPGEVSIPAGESARTTYTFRSPGSLIIGCHLPGHYEYGMRGAVEVR